MFAIQFAICIKLSIVDFLDWRPLRCKRRARLKTLGRKNYCSDCHDEVVRNSEDADLAIATNDSDTADEEPAPMLRGKRSFKSDIAL